MNISRLQKGVALTPFVEMVNGNSKSGVATIPFVTTNEYRLQKWPSHGTLHT
jgi:hypothetical protein